MSKEVTPEFTKAVTTLLYQLADDDYLISYRGSEWLGLAPHIEEDVAFSSITQDTMGHAKLYYTLLEELGEGKSDSLAQIRPAEERCNCSTEIHGDLAFHFDFFCEEFTSQTA